MSEVEMSRQEQFSGTKDVIERLRFDEKKLEDYMAAHIEGFEGPLKVEQFKGGQSNPTYRLSTSGARYVLRRKPPGKLLPSAHAMDREYRVISAFTGPAFRCRALISYARMRASPARCFTSWNALRGACYGRARFPTRRRTIAAPSMMR